MCQIILLKSTVKPAEPVVTFKQTKKLQKLKKILLDLFVTFNDTSLVKT